MCDVTDVRRRWTSSLRLYQLVICGLAFCIPSASNAQSSAAVRQRVEKLLDIWQAAERRVFTADSIALSRLQLDTLDYGSLRVVIKKEDVQYLAPGGRLASRILAETLGSDTALTRATPFRVFVGDSLSGQTLNQTPGEVEIQIRGSYDADMVSRLFVEGAGRILGDLPHNIRTWVGGKVLVGDLDPRMWERSYIEMATIPSQAVNQCFLGDMASCQLAIFPPSDDSATQLYNTSERRWAVSLRGRAVTRRGRDSWRIDPVLFDECMEGVDEACLAALQSAPGGFSSPFSSIVRTTLTRTALDIGGAGAYGRLVESTRETVAGHLEYAAGESIDSVISAWRYRAMRARPDSTIAPPALRWWSLLWIVVFVATALRSSRWR